MGKTARKVSTARLREFRKQRKIMAWVTVVLFFVWVASVVVNGVFLPNATWMPVVAMLVYLAGLYLLRQFSKCPYCDEPIMTKFRRRTTCPHCGKPIIPDYSGK